MTLPYFPADLTHAALGIAGMAFLSGMARGFSGFGAALVFIPVASALVGPVVAMPVLMLTDLAMSGPIYVNAFRKCDWREVRRMAAGGIIGFPIGAYF